MAPEHKQRIKQAFDNEVTLNALIEAGTRMIFREWQNAKDELTREELHAQFRALQKVKRIIYAIATESA